MRIRLALLISVIGAAPSLAQPDMLPPNDQFIESEEQAQWGVLYELVGRDFVFGSTVVTFRWIEEPGYVEMVYWGLGGRTTHRLQRDPTKGFIELFNVGALGLASMGQLRAADDGTLFFVKNGSKTKAWIEGGLAGGLVLNGTPLTPVASGTPQATKIERLIAEGKLSEGTPLPSRYGADGSTGPATSFGGADGITLAQFEAASEPEPEIEIDPETGAVRQTPAGAIRFLDTLAQQGSLTLLHHFQAWPAFTFTSKLDGVRRGSDCQALFSGRPEQISPARGGTYPAGTPEFDSALRQVAGMYRHQPLPWVIDWSRVSAVSFGGYSAKHGNDQQTVVVTGTRPIELRLPDQALAKRVHYAITFLKESCDRTADTGF